MQPLDDVAAKLAERRASVDASREASPQPTAAELLAAVWGDGLSPYSQRRLVRFLTRYPTADDDTIRRYAERLREREAAARAGIPFYRWRRLRRLVTVPTFTEQEYAASVADLTAALGAQVRAFAATVPAPAPVIAASRPREHRRSGSSRARAPTSGDSEPPSRPRRLDEDGHYLRAWARCSAHLQRRGFVGRWERVA